MTDGAKANKAGDVAEKIIECILSERGFKAIRHHKIGKSIYETHELKCDFFISNAAGYPDGLIIECKWQDSSGSADEKYPYLCLNIKERFPCPAIVVTGGRGAKKGALLWLSKQCDEKLIGVYSIEEFMSYVSREMVPSGD